MEFTIHPEDWYDSKVLESEQYFLDTHFLNLIKFKRNDEQLMAGIVDLLTGFFKIKWSNKDYSFSHVHCGYGNNDEKVIAKNSIVIDIHYYNKSENKSNYTRMTLAKWSS